MLERRDSVAGEVQLCQGGEEPSGEGRDGREGVAVEGQDGETVQAGQCARRNLGDKVEAHVSLLHRQGERGMESSLSLLPGEGWGGGYLFPDSRDGKSLECVAWNFHTHTQACIRGVGGGGVVCSQTLEMEKVWNVQHGIFTLTRKRALRLSH